MSLLGELNKSSELRKYENEYEHLFVGGSRVAQSSLNNSTSHNKAMVSPLSIQRKKGAIGSYSRVGSANPMSRVVL
jgi:hypothetical protein